MVWSFQFFSRSVSRLKLIYLDYNEKYTDPFVIYQHNAMARVLIEVVANIEEIAKHKTIFRAKET